MMKNLQTAFSARQYMLAKYFEIYYYSDSHFSGVKGHTHDYYEFYFFLEGDISMYIEGNLYDLTPGDVILIPPGVAHHILLHSENVPYRRFVFWISQEYCNLLLNLSPDYVYLMQHVAVTKHYVHHYDALALNALQAKAFQLIEEQHSNRFGKSAKISLCVNDLILHLNRTIYEMEHPNVPREEQGLYQKIMLYIEGHLDEELSLDQLAGIFYVSKYHIAHVFKENLGMSIHQFITKKRLSMCRDAILGQASISDAYLMCGFKDYSSFFRAFKKEYGLSPKEYRELFLEKARESDASILKNDISNNKN